MLLFVNPDQTAVFVRLFHGLGVVQIMFSQLGDPGHALTLTLELFFLLPNRTSVSRAPIGHGPSVP